MTEENRDEMDTEENGFKLWMRKVNNIIESTIFLSYLDIPDVDYYAMYDAGETPREAAEYAIEYAMEN